MGLQGYRAFRDVYYDNGMENSVVLQSTFKPDFFNRHTEQLWDAGVQHTVYIDKWIGTTLKNRSLHEIYITNNSNSPTVISFSPDYRLSDEESFNNSDNATITIKPNGTAYFYCTALLENNNLILVMRTGSQDDKNV